MNDFTEQLRARLARDGSFQDAIYPRRNCCDSRVQQHHAPDCYAQWQRLDPPDCGCTDCITGHSRPARADEWDTEADKPKPKCPTCGTTLNGDSDAI